MNLRVIKGGIKELRRIKHLLSNGILKKESELLFGINKRRERRQQDREFREQLRKENAEGVSE